VADIWLSLDVVGGVAGGGGIRGGKARKRG